MNVHATPSATKATPALPSAKPEAIGLSSARLQLMSDAFQREIDKGTTPGVVTMVARRGQIGWFEAQGKQDPAGSAAMAKDSIFRIFSMTKPVTSVAAMILYEEGKFLMDDPVSKYIPEFANVKVLFREDGQQWDTTELKRPLTLLPTSPLMLSSSTLDDQVGLLPDTLNETWSPS